MKLFSMRDGVALSIKEARQCFGLSKQTVPGENEQEASKYEVLPFVEFLEMIGRVAHFKYRGSELENIGLERKLETILDELFKLIGETRKDAVETEEVESESESDDDY